jgi:hypothetical protein
VLKASVLHRLLRKIYPTYRNIHGVGNKQRKEKKLQQSRGEALYFWPTR